MTKQSHSSTPKGIKKAKPEKAVRWLLLHRETDVKWTTKGKYRRDEMKRVAPNSDVLREAGDNENF